MKIDFSDAQLFLSLRSPFARRLRLAFQENGVRYQEEIRDVWKVDPAYFKVNPLHRVPTLQLKTGERLTESSLILDLLYRGDRPLSYRSEKDALKGFEWSGMAVGLIEKTIEFFLEKLRPESAWDEEILREHPETFHRVLAIFEQEIAGRATLLGYLTQADLDLGSALTYLTFRFDPQILRSYPHTQRYLEGLEARPAFERTRPS